MEARSGQPSFGLLCAGSAFAGVSDSRNNVRNSVHICLSGVKSWEKRKLKRYFDAVNREVLDRVQRVVRHEKCFGAQKQGLKQSGDEELFPHVYDTVNRLQSLTDFNKNQFTFGYDALSRRISLGRPNE